MNSLMIGYATDLVVADIPRDVDAAQMRLNHIMRRVTAWMGED